MSLTVSGTKTVICDFDPSEVYIVSHSKLVGGDYSPTQFRIQASSNPQACTKAAFENSYSKISSLTQRLLNSTNLRDSNSLRFQIETNLFFDGWHYCSATLNQLLTTQTSFSIENKTICLDPSDTSDPCCNTWSDYASICLPSLQNVTTSTYEVNSDQLETMCKDPTCTGAYLLDFSLFHNQEQVQSNCRAGTEDTTLSNLLAYDIYRSCKSQTIDSLPVSGNCLADSDCSFNSTNYICDVVSHRCLIPHSIPERLFLRCLVSNSTVSQLLYLATTYNLNASLADTNSFSSQLWSRLISSQSVGQCFEASGITNILKRTHYQIRNTANACWKDFNCPLDLTCQDTTCLLPELSCLEWCNAGNRWEEIGKKKERKSMFVILLLFHFFFFFFRYYKITMFGRICLQLGSNNLQQCNNSCRMSKCLCKLKFTKWFLWCL